MIRVLLVMLRKICAITSGMPSMVIVSDQTICFFSFLFNFISKGTFTAGNIYYKA